MTELIRTLEQSMLWLKSNMPRYADSFLPGISYEEIQGASQIIGITFPTEFYELYSWQNGTEEMAIYETEKLVYELLFPVLAFMPLNTAIQHYEEIRSDLSMQEWFSFAGKELFPFAWNNGDYCALPIIQEKVNFGPVFIVEKQGGGIYPFYSTITSFLQTLVKCYESNSLYLDGDRNLLVDIRRRAEILREYNSKILQVHLDVLKKLLDAIDRSELEHVCDTQLSDFLSEELFPDRSFMDNKSYASSYEFPSLREYISETLFILEEFRSPEAASILVEIISNYPFPEQEDKLFLYSTLQRSLATISDDLEN